MNTYNSEGTGLIKNKRAKMYIRRHVDQFTHTKNYFPHIKNCTTYSNNGKTKHEFGKKLNIILNEWAPGKGILYTIADMTGHVIKEKNVIK